MSAATGPDLLYHYTDACGLIGIVENGAVWATDAEFLNDAQELRFGREPVREALLTRAAELCPTDEFDQSNASEYSRATVMRSAADYFQPGSVYPKHAGLPHGRDRAAGVVYVTCFCEERDLLSQWRGYGVGGGFAIGFARTALQGLRPVEVSIARALVGRAESQTDDTFTPATEYEPPGLPVRLEAIRYGREAVDAVIDYVLDSIAPGPTGHPGVSGFYRAQTMVLPALATIKDSAFAEEREWRLVIISPDGNEERHFRAGALGVVPYVHVPFDVLAIREIVIGPGAEPDLRRRAVDRLLTSKGLSDVTVALSQVPFRG